MISFSRLRTAAVAVVASIFCLAVTLCGVAMAHAADSTIRKSDDGVAALGRIEPEHGIIHVGVPTTPAASSGSTIGKLHVEAGDDVKQGQILAEIDSVAFEKAALDVARAELALAERQAEMADGQEQEVCSRAEVAARVSRRSNNLVKTGASSTEQADVAAGDAKSLSGSCAAARVGKSAAAAKVDVQRANVAKAEASLDRCYVRAPLDGRVLEIHARPGEFVGMDGVLDLGRTSRMYAIAEIYETDIGRVHVGQKATVTSTALPEALDGRVERIRLKVRKQDATGTDPAARKDARIIEAEVLLDRPEVVAALTNLQVEIVLAP